MRMSHGHMHGTASRPRVSHGHMHAIAERKIAPAMPKRARREKSAVKFGAIIRRLRAERGWTLIDFGRKANMNPTYLGFVERGENVPTLAAAIHLAKVLGTEASTILREMEAESGGSDDSGGEKPA
jgi:ribosome-binding protein aMBF1 (putative translation factor)